MKEAFARILEENGIKVPKMRLLEPEIIFERREKKFWTKWSTAFDAYKQYANAVVVMSSDRLWRKCQSISVGLYNKSIIRTPTPILGKFSNPQEALQVITSALSKCRDPRKEVLQNRVEHLKLWFFDIVEKRPAGCSLIVLKDTSYTPKTENVERFTMDVQSGMEAQVCYCTGLSNRIYWIAVPVEKYKEQRFENWAFSIDSTTVEYY